ncbi:putative ubiquitin carboxyl-terminal hydrolase 24-like [Apostichopus japonicus]|uniref:Putative ubiquitin carboxyl-terminal hydrolase 24-like n=1 Tax=Stichopus japonicus TaxID=307972 RepID=A0A2G8LKT6_STIJA|nr:putative ubiquitin carboxyl-terminal hydrolase 24-like [Apostichopus japonicus]
MENNVEKKWRSLLNKVSYGPIKLSKLDLNTDKDVYSRRWTSLYTREFGDLHSLLATLVMTCTVDRYQTIAQGDFPDRQRLLEPPHKELLEMPSAMQEILWGPECLRYIREAVLAFREIAPDHRQQTILEMILYCSFCNEDSQ